MKSTNVSVSKEFLSDTYYWLGEMAENTQMLIDLGKTDFGLESELKEIYKLREYIRDILGWT